MSLGIKNIDLLEGHGLVPLQNTSSLSVNEARFDPFYRKNSNDQNINESIKFTRKDIEEYATYCLATPKGEVKGFSNWKKLPQTSIADLSELNLSDINGLNKGRFKHCNLFFTNFSGSNLDEITFKHCNLTSANFSTNNIFIPSIFSTQTKNSMVRAVFENCNLSSATLNKC